MLTLYWHWNLAKASNYTHAHKHRLARTHRKPAKAQYKLVFPSVWPRALQCWVRSISFQSLNDLLHTYRDTYIHTRRQRNICMYSYNLAILSCLSGIMRETESELVWDQMQDFSADQMWEVPLYVCVCDCFEVLHYQIIWNQEKLKMEIYLYERRNYLSVPSWSLKTSDLLHKEVTYSNVVPLKNNISDMRIP